MKLKDTGLTVEQIKEKVQKYMVETYERFDFLAETAEGMYLYDENGTPYLDFYAGIAVNSAGSCTPKVVAAVRDQVGNIMHTFNYPYTIPQALLAEKVCTTLGMDKIFFQNSGAEANEAMIKMARKYGIEKYGPNKYHIVTAKMGSRPGSGRDHIKKEGEVSMKHFVISVGCEYGSGGPAIGKKIADDLGIEYYDRDLIDQIIERTGVSKRLLDMADAGVDVKGCTAEEVRRLMDMNDNMNHARYKQITGTYRGDRHNRHILMDSSLLGIEGTAKYIEELVAIVNK